MTRRGPCAAEWGEPHNGTLREDMKYWCMSHARGKRAFGAGEKPKPIRKRPRLDTREDKLTKALVGMQSCLVARSQGSMAECSGGIERAHIHHRGMGGKDVGWYRNTIPLCGAHHRGGKGEHRLGPTTFDATYNTDRQVEADRIGDLVDTKISAGA